MGLNQAIIHATPSWVEPHEYCSPPKEQGSPQSEHNPAYVSELLWTAVRCVHPNISQNPISGLKVQECKAFVHPLEPQHRSRELGSYQKDHTLLNPKIIPAMPRVLPQRDTNARAALLLLLYQCVQNPLIHNQWSGCQGRCLSPLSIQTAFGPLIILQRLRKHQSIPRYLFLAGADWAQSAEVRH